MILCTVWFREVEVRDCNPRGVLAETFEIVGLHFSVPLAPSQLCVEASLTARETPPDRSCRMCSNSSGIPATHRRPSQMPWSTRRKLPLGARVLAIIITSGQTAWSSLSS